MGRRGPSLVALAAVAAVPAVLLGGLVLVANAQRPTASPTPSSTTVVTPSTTPTPLFSFRRAPGVLVADHHDGVVAMAADPLMAAVDSQSCAAVAADGVVVAAANPGAALIPASTLKVLVAAVALDVLGGDHVFTTEVRGATPVNGVVQGDLVLVGGGDPVLSESWYAEASPARRRPPNVITSAEALADAVVAAGITQVTGRVVGDGSRYDDERYPPGWAADLRGTIDFPPIGALTINDTTSRADVVGSDPAGHAAAVLDQLLRDRGVEVSGQPAVGVGPPGSAVLASLQSAPLTTLVRELLSTSDNGAAELLVKELGLVAAGQGSRVAGVQVIVDRLTAWGVPTAGIQLTDGSGLSRDNRLSCDTLLAVLARTAMTDPLGQGMAIAGEDGTTLAGQLEVPGVEGVLRAKTGSLTGVKALAGYYPAGDRTIAFVLVLNGSGAGEFADEWGLLTDALIAAADAALDEEALAP
ncbi:MAG TPA: D-alanyl-D-alanine carboxypeptidase/D-alanyl-D-alanine-endopeptidase [Acidimicrobiaceae bacterium]|nr:D-alanyl-D-alanine carboxypeptidase/D-alanyl-D-alanine-endopeptidase [Acidimicrobiaceae bacterium]